MSSGVTDRPRAAKDQGDDGKKKNENENPDTTPDVTLVEI